LELGGPGGPPIGSAIVRAVIETAPSLFTAVTQPMLVVLYCRFWTAYGRHPQGSSGWDKQAVPKRRQTTTNIRFATNQKSENVIYNEAEARNFFMKDSLTDSSMVRRTLEQWW